MSFFYLFLTLSLAPGALGKSVNPGDVFADGVVSTSPEVQEDVATAMDRKLSRYSGNGRQKRGQDTPKKSPPSKSRNKQNKGKKPRDPKPSTVSAVNGTPRDSRFDTKNRIINGNPVEEGSRPWLVSLGMINVEDGNFKATCGGSPITPNVVLTAAHCQDSIEFADFYRYSVSDGVDAEDLERMTIIDKDSSIIVHPDYDDFTFDNDVALVILPKPLDERATLVKLNDDPNIPEIAGDLLDVSGWGHTSVEDGEPSDTPLFTVLGYYTPQDCKADYAGREEEGFIVTEHMLCAKGDGTDACQGDSGGPLIVSQEGGGSPSDPPVQVGIVSWGLDCADPEFAGVYTRISSILPWILETVCETTGECGCEDLTGDFIGMGIHERQRSCAWVAERAWYRCMWYGKDHCPHTCGMC